MATCSVIDDCLGIVGIAGLAPIPKQGFFIIFAYLSVIVGILFAGVMVFAAHIGAVCDHSPSGCLLPCAKSGLEGTFAKVTSVGTLSYPNVHATTSDPKIITAFLQDAEQPPVRVYFPVRCPIDFDYLLNITISAPHQLHGVLHFNGCRTLVIGSKSYWTPPTPWTLLSEVAEEPLPPVSTPQTP